MPSGTELARSFFEREVQPRVEAAFPSVAYLSGRLGSGSDVLGVDDDRSRDHDFGCRLTLLVDDEAAQAVHRIDELLERDLPAAFAGFPVRFATSWDGRLRHKVDVATVTEFATSRLGLDPTKDLDTVGWLSLTGQSILEVTGGAIFHDTTSGYRQLVERLAWYPDDIWRYVLAAGWSRIGQELPFVGRTGERGDDLGSSVITARLARDLIHLAFLVHRTWPPYPKWAGTALLKLDSGARLASSLRAATGAATWREREDALCEAVDLVGADLRRAGFALPTPLVQPFFDRPFRAIDPAIPTSIRVGIADPDLLALPAGLGSVEQWSDNVDLLSHPARRRQVSGVYLQLMAAGRA